MSLKRRMLVVALLVVLLSMGYTATGLSLSSLYHERGNQLERKGEYHRALTEYLRAVSWAKADVRAHLALGRIHEKIARDKNLSEQSRRLLLLTAKGFFLKAISLQPVSGEAHMALASVFERLGQMDGASEELEKALLLDPTNTALHYAAGMWYALREEKAKAMREMEFFLHMGDVEKARVIEERVKG